MMFQILYSSEGYKFTTQYLTENQKENYVRALTNAGITFDVLEREDKKINVVSVIFKLDDTTTYTFEDPDGLAQIGDIVEVECSDGRRKNVLVKAARLRTRDEINAFCAKIGYPELGKVTKRVWRPRK